MKYQFRVGTLLAIAWLGSGAAALAATSAVNASIVSPTLQLSTTVQKGIQLTLGTGTSGTTRTVSSASDYSLNFGNMDALGINTPCGSEFAPTPAGTSPAQLITLITS